MCSEIVIASSFDNTFDLCEKMLRELLSHLDPNVEVFEKGMRVVVKETFAFPDLDDSTQHCPRERKA